jgi:monofunctional biosynthetic peptidoglycan transglycosylase
MSRRKPASKQTSRSQGSPRTKPAPAVKARFWAGRWILALGLLAVGGLLAHALLSLPSRAEVSRLARTPPQTTALIEARAREARDNGHKIRRVQRWVSISDVAPELVACAVASEDARFFLHDGVDLKQVGQALRRDLSERHFTRGASTLTQQLAKNLWLTENKSVLRKLQELVLAGRLEESLTKERILELYLNEVEWGEGIYGVAAASRAYFGKSPRELSLGESAVLVAMLPAPRKLQPTLQSGPLLTRTNRVLDRVGQEHFASMLAVDLARVEAQRLLQAPAS